MRKSIPVLVVLTALVVFLTASLAVAAPKAIPANDIVRGVFVDPPGGRPLKASATESNTTYAYKRISWATNVVHYEVNTASAPSYLDTTAVAAAIDDSFSSWQNQYNVLGRPDQSYIFYVKDGTTLTAGPHLDGHNVVSFAPLSSGTLAATYYWYDRRTKNLIEFDIVFNTMYTWSTSGETNKYDVWNLGTHEAGHTLQLGDLYKSQTSELTMYGYGFTGETKKQTLGMGDMLGLERIYPTP